MQSSGKNLRMMNSSIIHDENGSWTWIRRTTWQNLRTDKFIKQILRIWSLDNIPNIETIDSVNWKNRPPFRTLNRLVFMWRHSNRRPTILSIHCTFIRSRFIQKKQLIGVPPCQLMNPCIPESLIPFRGTLFGLDVSECQKKAIKIQNKKYRVYVQFFGSNSCVWDSVEQLKEIP